MTVAVKHTLEGLLRSNRLAPQSPPLRGGTCPSPLPTGIASIDTLLEGGLPRGQISEVHGPTSSGRVGLVYSLVARATQEGRLAAWVDPGDTFDPLTASRAGVDLTQLLWLRGLREPGDRTAAAVRSRTLSALGTLLDSGLFEVVVLDIAGTATPFSLLPPAAWLRLGRKIEHSPVGLVILASEHTARGPRGVSLCLRPKRPRWSGGPGPGRLFQALETQAVVDRLGGRQASLTLQAVH